MPNTNKSILQSKLAFRKFYEEHRMELLGFFVSRVKRDEDAEELMHDTFLAFLDSLPLFERRSSLKTYLYSIARHELADYWRKKYAKKVIRTVPLLGSLYADRLYSSIEMKIMIDSVFSRLSDEMVELLVLKYVKGFSVVEIAEKLSISAKAVESRLFRARHAFQKAYVLGV